MDPINNTRINVVALLKEPVGSTRSYDLHLDALPLGGDALAEGVDGDVKLTRLRDEILAKVRVRGAAELECVRCLNTYVQPFETEFAEEFRQSVDVRTGVGLPEDPDAADDDDRFAIDENHELDLAEALRQWILLALPMRPDCGEACPGPDLAERDAEEPIDDRLAALSSLLDDSADGRESDRT